MKRPRRTYRLHDDTQAAIEAMADEFSLGLGEVVEQQIGFVAHQIWGAGWRDVVRERRRLDMCDAPEGPVADEEPASGDPHYNIAQWMWVEPGGRGAPPR